MPPEAVSPPFSAASPPPRAGVIVPVPPAREGEPPAAGDEDLPPVEDEPARDDVAPVYTFSSTAKLLHEKAASSPVVTSAAFRPNFFERNQRGRRS